MENKINIKQQFSYPGLTDTEVQQQREFDGKNQFSYKKNNFLESVLSVFTEPMFILLLAACVVYFFLKQYTEALTMIGALLFVAGIEIFQNFRSQKAIKALSGITKSRTKVIRNGETIEIGVEDLVTKDIVICEEGTIIPADAVILTSNDFLVNEAILTGESVSLQKFSSEMIMQGTLVVGGYCFAEIKAVGKETTLAGIGELVATTGKEKTPLQLKVSKFVRLMVIAGISAFAFVWVFYWWESGSIMHGLLHGLTMAMSVLPEEIPVALSTFMALGAYRLLKHGIIARSPKTVETLGSATVICLDKTGTLTLNLMNVAHAYIPKTGEEVNFNISPKKTEVLEYAMWASEENPFDPMEKSIHSQYTDLYEHDQRNYFKMVKEFPLSGTPPVMTHIFQNEEEECIIGCKGALEGVLRRCTLSQEEKTMALDKGMVYAKKGLRVLGVAKGHWNSNDQRKTMDDIVFDFLGIITFMDPIDKQIPRVIDGFYKAGLDVKMITGDYKETAVAIAEQTNIKTNKILTGNELACMSDEELNEIVSTTNIFVRVSPDVKLRIVNALKQVGEIVAMTGDGVNDAPALKSAHIGIAMGKRGTDVAKGAAGLILVDDDLSKMIEAIFLGRRINENLTKAIRYIISIHIPIILLVTLPIFLNWIPALLFSPIHVIFLELIMGPTCSIIYENEAIPEKDLSSPVGSGNHNILKAGQLWITIIQGLAITLGCVIAGYYASSLGLDDFKIRTYIFTTLILSNIFLTLINRSFTQNIIHTLKWKNNLIPLIIFISVLLLIVILYVPQVSLLFDVLSLQLKEFGWLVLIAMLATFWIEPLKYFKYRRNQS